MFASNKSAAPSSSKLFVEDVFSTWLYTSTGSNQTINNGIDLAGKGGMVLFKGRSGSGATYGWGVFDTNRGVNKGLRTNDTSASFTDTTSLTSFNSNGFGIGIDNNVYVANAFNGGGSASWTFRKAPKFFDVVTYTGTGSTQSISHNLGIAPGTVIVKSYSNTGPRWMVWHRSVSPNILVLNTTAAATNFGADYFGNNTVNVDPTSTAFTVGSSSDVNFNGATYVAYLFAHDTTSTGIIQCGSYTGNGTATGPTINLGWEPQWLLIKNTSAAENWVQFDNMRGLPNGGASPILNPNTVNNEAASSLGMTLTPTGFFAASGGATVNASGNNYVYIAIRRGPMRTPTLGTTVFSPNITNSPTNTVVSTNFPVDLQTSIYRPGGFGNFWVDRLRGLNSPGITTSTRTLQSDTTAAETGDNGLSDNFNNTGYTVGASYNNVSVVYWNFRRAPSFFDEVCYTGTGGTSNTFSHNLGVAPELVITKGRGSVTNWGVYHASLGATKALLLNSTSAEIVSANYWNNTAPTATQVSLGTTTNSSTTFVAYLFASCPGVSKVGSYTGNGTTQTINCGFAAGARFVLIKRTDSTGDWYVWDTARGMTALTDPYLLMNSTAAETSTLGAVTTTSVGFSVNASVLAAINTSGASYIFLAIA